MKQYKFKVNGNKYAVDIVKAEDNTVELEVNGTSYTVELEREVKTTKTPRIVRSPAKKAAAPSMAGKAKSVKAPLPGTIISVDVKVGDTVKHGDKLLVMEAMKMENTINSDASGEVKAIKVNAGDSVLQGDVLVELG
ncbi:MAG: biotin/lipoyl-binding protein [Cytophagales bacterium]|nr:biotin/lipoyl-binding protein [Cytophagales bacterium]